MLRARKQFCVERTKVTIGRGKRGLRGKIEVPAAQKQKVSPPEDKAEEDNAVGPFPWASTKGKEILGSNFKGISAADIRQEVSNLLTASISKNTQETYSTALIKFDSFRLKQNMEPAWLPKLSDIKEFIAASSLEGLAYSTICTYVSAISLQCKLKNFDDPTHNFIKAKMLEGKKKTSAKPDSRLPITSGILSTIINGLHLSCRETYETLLFTSVYTLAFYGCFRVGEIVSSNKQAKGILDINDIKIQKDNSLKIILRYCKTDQYGKGTEV
ncbi:uncharacterized protein LOC134246852, partial [Saccostrea cucullata]|uniref:uncharacterized protein LOC134246852 n=1 Tax=Saccostrea cuccullata TaxID=36930 RepID=UPI002ED03DD3